MKKIASNILITFLALCFTSLGSVADENTRDSEINAYVGNFDFSDVKQRAILFGFQHRNPQLSRETFLGKLSPITGGFITENKALYV